MKYQPYGFKIHLQHNTLRQAFSNVCWKVGLKPVRLIYGPASEWRQRPRQVAPVIPTCANAQRCERARCQAVFSTPVIPY
jgi:hypothetical protein